MSERTLDSDLKSGAQSPVFRYVVMVDLSFPSGNVRLHNGIGTHTFGGNDYSGVGGFGSISAMSESTEVADNPVDLTLSSISTDIINAITTDDIYGRDADIYVCAVDEGYQLLGTPTNWIVGHMEYASLNIGEENAVTIRVQTRAAKMRQRNNKRFTIEHHQAEYPGDRFFEYLPYVMNADVAWAGQKVRGTQSITGGESMGGGAGGGGRFRDPTRYTR